MMEKEDKTVVLLIPCVVFLFLFLTGTITSGYHFVDDHEVIRMKVDLKSSTLIDVTKKWVQEDLVSNNRFRPLYYIHRVFEAELFGSNFFLWSLYNGIQCCIALIFFYLGIRNLKFSPGESILFLIIVFLGPQSAIWWRLGPSEGLAMFFFSLSFYFMSKSLEGKNYILNNVLFIFFLILSSLCKESFVLIIPGFLFFKLWHEKNNLWLSLKETLTKNLILLIPVIVLVIELVIIKFYVGTNYSGLSSDLTDNLKGFFSTGVHFLRSYLNIIIVGVILFVINLFRKKIIFRIDPFSLIFFFLIITPNLILYSKSIFAGRYFLPSTIGLGFLVVSFIKGFEENTGSFKKLALTLVMISFLPFLINAYTDAIRFSKEGTATKRLLSAISKNYIAGSQAMVIVDPIVSYEKSVSLKIYLNFEDKIDLYGYPLVINEDAESDAGLVEGWKSYFNDKLSENLNTKPGLLIFLDCLHVDKFFKTSNLLQSDYTAVDIGNSKFALLQEINK
jgi:hypothetical protein